MTRWVSRTSSDHGLLLQRGDSSKCRVAPVRAGAGFTIVELLIVVVVIAILAAITIVAFNGITQRAKASAASAAAEQASKKVMIYMATNGDQTPSDLAAAGVADQNGTTYQYRTYDSGKSYCITATTNSVSAFTNNVDQTSPMAGACPGHGANGGGVITNLVTNPSVEVNATSWNVANGAVCNRQASAALVGSWGMNCVTTSNLDSGANIPAPGIYTAGTTYTASFKLRSNAATTYFYMLSIQGAAGGSCSGGSGTGCTGVSLTPGQSTTITLTWTPTTTGSIVFYALRKAGQGTGSASFDLDGAVLIAGSGPLIYADGDSQGWAWNGTAGNSTSTGPAQ